MSLDQKITASYDTPDRHKYTTVDDTFGVLELDMFTRRPVLGNDGRPVYRSPGKYIVNAVEADRWSRELDALISKTDSREVVVAAMERKAGLFDALRTGLADARIELLGPNDTQKVAAMRASGKPDLLAAADKLEAAKTDAWKKKKQQELDGADTVLVKLYAAAVAFARANKIDNARVARALRRLAYYTSVLGEERMASLVTATPDPTTRGATKLTYQPRQYLNNP